MHDESIESGIYACRYAQGLRQPDHDRFQVATGTRMNEEVNEVTNRLRVRE